MLANSSLSLRILGRVSGLKRAAGQALTHRQFSTPVVPTILKTGTFIHQLPEIYPSDVYFKKAIKKTREVKIDPTIKNLRNANRKHCAIVLDTLMKALTMPITHVLNIHKNEMKQLHPYELTVVDLTVVARVKAGHPHLSNVLSDLKELRAETSRVAKSFSTRARNAVSAMEARDLMVEGTRELEALYNVSVKAHALKELGEIQKVLRRIPIIELNTPTVVLVGAPNVGKSTIVRAVSSGTPEVNDYPFTTRGVTVGHIVDVDLGKRYQVMDTPGLLDRAEEDRNEMEKLTFASMLHLPTAVVYVIDPTGLSGEKSTLQAQLGVREYLKTRFPQRPWIDVVSKADIELTEEILAQLPKGHLRISVHSGVNMDLLRGQLDGMFETLKAIFPSEK
eukprot:gene18675-21251_t